MNNVLKTPTGGETYEWRFGTTYAPERSLSDYETVLGINESDLKGRVLDLGSGNVQYLNAKLAWHDIEHDIISVNPDMMDEKFRRDLMYSDGFEQKTAAAIAQQLPFSDESFDRVLALGSVTVYASPSSASDESVAAWMGEVARVLKPDGLAKLGPLYGEDDIAIYESIHSRMENGEHFNIGFEPVTLEDEAVVTDDVSAKQLYRLIISKTSV